MNGTRKAALLLLALGLEHAAEVLRHLDPDAVEALAREIHTGARPAEGELDAVLAEAHALTAPQQDAPAAGGFGTAREMLTRTLGEAGARDLLQRVEERLRPPPFGFAQQLGVGQLAAVLRDEHPQVAALVLGHLRPPVAAAVLQALPREQAVEISARLTRMERTAPEVVATVEAALRERMGGARAAAYIQVGGPRFAARTLGQTDRTTEREILQRLEAKDPGLAARIRQHLFLFEDLALLDDRALQRVLRRIEISDLPLALQKAPPPLVERILANLSVRTAAMVREEMAAASSARTRQVHEAQQRIVAVARAMEENEEIVVERDIPEPPVGVPPPWMAPPHPRAAPPPRASTPESRVA